MRIILTTLILIFACINAISLAATSCVQIKGSGIYRTADQNKECVLPDISVAHVPAPESANRHTPISAPSYLSEGNQLNRSNTRADIWELRFDDISVYAALKRWTFAAGWQLSWEIPVDFPVEIEDRSTGSFEQSIRRVLTAFRVSDYPPYPCFHGNKVLRVVRRAQGNGDECL